jgi:DNA modification methylase
MTSPLRDKARGPKQRKLPVSSENCRPVAPVSYLETGVLHCGDNLDLLGQFPSECIDLIYLDPPFFSNRQYEVIWGDEAEVRSFEDRWKGGMEHYIEWMRDRVAHLHRVLKPTGVMYLHCDASASHYLKVMADRQFGRANFRNEIIWCYAGGGIPKRDFPRKHDNILRYTKSDDYFYAPVYRPYSPGTLQRGRTKVKGKYFEEGLRKEGTPVNDWWVDVPKLTSPTDPEKQGYPTQQPEALLERIIATSSVEGAIVLDPFCGCGTTVSVAERMKRQWIGIDISPTAVRVMRSRLQRKGCYPNVYGLPETEDDLRNLQHFEFQNWIIDVLHGTHAPRKSGDMGIDGYSFLERMPIQVKQSEKVGRNVVDNFETAIRRDGKDRGYIVAFSFSRGAFEEVARAKSEGLHIALVTVATLLNNPADKPLDPKLDDLTAELMRGAREAATKHTPQQAPRPTAEELIASSTS